MKKLILLLSGLIGIFSIQANVPGFSGNWYGTCSNDQIFSVSIKTHLDGKVQIDRKSYILGKTLHENREIQRDYLTKSTSRIILGNDYGPLEIVHSKNIIGPRDQYLMLKKLIFTQREDVLFLQIKTNIISSKNMEKNVYDVFTCILKRR